MEVFQNLPYELCLKIMIFSHPSMESSMKHAIRVTSTHQRIKRIQRKWNPENTWDETTQQVTTQEERIEMIDTLAQCGCCVRHSQGVYKEPHCTHITGSHTIKKKHKKKTYDNKLCTCWCRLHMRQFINLEIM